MVNKIFKLGLIIISIIALIFILTPILFLVFRGVFLLYDCLKEREVLFSIKLSLITSIISTVIVIAVAIPIGYSLSRLNFKFKKFISILFYIPMSMPHLILGIALLIVCGNSITGRFLQRLGLDFIFTIKGIILAQVFVNISFAIKMLKASVDKVSKKLEFIGRTLGCDRFKNFIYIVIPLIKKEVLVAFMIVWSKALGEFGAVMLLVGITSMKTELLPTSIYLNVSTGNMDIAIGVATILIIISFLIILPFEILEENANARN